jgi:hypothetical protein
MDSAGSMDFFMAQQITLAHKRGLTAYNHQVIKSLAWGRQNLDMDEMKNSLPRVE